MKKLILLISACTIVVSASFAQACAIDSTNFASGTYIYPDSLPCVSQGTAYSGTVSLQVPDSLDAHLFESFLPPNTYYVHVDSLRLDSITGTPSGITTGTNPILGTWIHGGQYACAIFSGTTTDTIGKYPINIYGDGCIHGTIASFNIDSCQSGNLGAYLKYSLNVCYPTGIASVTGGVSMDVYPNPNQGAFTVSISSPDRISGSMSVVDQLGRTIYTQSIDITGTKQIPLELGNISSGAYMLMINAGGNRSLKQFIIK